MRVQRGCLLMVTSADFPTLSARRDPERLCHVQRSRHTDQRNPVAIRQDVYAVGISHAPFLRPHSDHVHHTTAIALPFAAALQPAAWVASYCRSQCWTITVLVMHARSILYLGERSLQAKFGVPLYQGAPLLAEVEVLWLS